MPMSIEDELNLLEALTKYHRGCPSKRAGTLTEVVPHAELGNMTIVPGRSLSL